jgi:hypothetical protein
VRHEDRGDNVYIIWWKDSRVVYKEVEFDSEPDYHFDKNGGI